MCPCWCFLPTVCCSIFASTNARTQILRSHNIVNRHRSLSSDGSHSTGCSNRRFKLETIRDLNTALQVTVRSSPSSDPMLNATYVQIFWDAAATWSTARTRTQAKWWRLVIHISIHYRRDENSETHVQDLFRVIPTIQLLMDELLVGKVYPVDRTALCDGRR